MKTFLKCQVCGGKLVEVLDKENILVPNRFGAEGYSLSLDAVNNSEIDDFNGRVTCNSCGEYRYVLGEDPIYPKIEFMDEVKS